MARIPHIQCECCKSLHPLRRREDGAWCYDCDWARIPGQRAPERFRIVYRDQTPASKAQRSGGIMEAVFVKKAHNEERARIAPFARDVIPRPIDPGVSGP